MTPEQAEVLEAAEAVALSWVGFGPLLPRRMDRLYAAVIANRVRERERNAPRLGQLARCAGKPASLHLAASAIGRARRA